MKVWEKVKNFFLAHKNREIPPERKENITFEELQVQSRLEKIKDIEIKESNEIKNSEVGNLSSNRKINKPAQEVKNSCEKASHHNKKKEIKCEVISESLLVNELVITEDNPRLEKVKEIELKDLIDVNNSNRENLPKERKLHNSLQGMKKNNEEAASSDKREESESEDVSKRILTNKLVVMEKNKVIKILNETLRNVAKKNSDTKKLIKPSTPMPSHNVEIEFEKYKEDYKYYLINGSDYERIKAIQRIKKAVREKESSQEEWLEILLNVYQASSEKIQKYILDTLKSFSFNMEEIKRVNEIIPPQEKMEDLTKIDFKLDKPRIVGNRTVKEKIKEPMQFDVNKEKEKEKFSFEGSKSISIDDSVKKEENKRFYQRPLNRQANLTEEVNRWKLNEKKYIKEECLKRNITSVYHFTNARNVRKILQHGILSLKELEEKNISYESNDNNRRDGMKNSTCWSISFPNNKYFHRVRERNEEMKWCVIEVDASVLFELDCYFYETNAASNAVRAQSSSVRKGYSSFIQMFERKTAKDEILPSKYPTDVQAEVLITEKIKPNRIKAIHTQDMKVFNYYYQKFPHLIKNTPLLFGWRP